MAHSSFHLLTSFAKLIYELLLYIDPITAENRPQISELWRKENHTGSEKGLLKSGILGPCFRASLPDKWFKSKVSCVKSQRSQVHLSKTFPR